MIYLVEEYFLLKDAIIYVTRSPDIFVSISKQKRPLSHETPQYLLLLRTLDLKYQKDFVPDLQDASVAIVPCIL